MIKHRALVSAVALLLGAIIAVTVLLQPVSAATCPDPLSEFATPHPAMTLESCVLDPGGQAHLKATYSVPIDQYHAVEAFLVATYGMRPLEWACCALFARGGGFELTAAQARRFDLNYPQHPEWTGGSVSMTVGVQDDTKSILDIDTHGVATVFVDIAEV